MLRRACCGDARNVMRNPGEAELVAEGDREDAKLPVVMVYGAGHVGRALARCLALLPVRSDGRSTRGRTKSPSSKGSARRGFQRCRNRRRATRRIGASHVILTHDHALDFLIAAEALARTDAPYVGMVGSALEARAIFELVPRNGRQRGGARTAGPADRGDGTWGQAAGGHCGLHRGRGNARHRHEKTARCTNKGRCRMDEVGRSAAGAERHHQAAFRACSPTMQGRLLGESRARSTRCSARTAPASRRWSR
jgi:hypothetical protein